MAAATFPFAKYPAFADLPESSYDSLRAALQVEQHAPGQSILRRNTGNTQLSFLVSGEVEIRRSFFERDTLGAKDARGRQPLEQLAGEAQVLAVSKCRVARIERRALDTLREQAREAAGYGVSILDDAANSSSDNWMLGDKSVEVDWMSRFLQSPMLSALPASQIQQLMAVLQRRDVSAGETLVQRGTSGDQFFVITSGMALIRTAEDGPFNGREIELLPGDHFGEEALVGDTVRSASVVMETDGTVGFLTRDMFDELLKPWLVETTDTLDPEGVLVDVRFAAECRGERPAQGALNIPIPFLRSRMQELDRSRRYLVLPRAGKRSELATFILRQAGFDARLLTC